MSDDKQLCINDDGSSQQHGECSSVERFYSLAAGEYWRAIRDVQEDVRGGGKGDTIKSGRVHLIKELKFVNNDVHTVILANHPDEPDGAYYPFLLNNFIDNFEFEPNGEEIRSQELKDATRRVEEAREDLDRTVTDPDYAIAQLSAPDSEDRLPDEFNREAGLPEGESSGTELVAVNPSELEIRQKRARNQVILAEAQKGLIQKKAALLSKQINAIQPYYTEKAMAALASVSGVIGHAKKLESGLHTLELYTGKEVHVIPIREGKRGDRSKPYAMRQRLLYMDEESLIDAALGGADFNSFSEFKRMLVSNPVLLDRILPEERCVVSMKFRRYNKDYDDPILGMINNPVNRESFLLIRDGECLFAVFSPLTYLPRLFPSRDDLDRPFKGRWRDDDKITLDDIRYADSHDKFESMALMYKRVLIMLWGLYDNTDTLGEFAYEDKVGHINLLSHEASEHCFQFIYDDELVLKEERPGFWEWHASKNEQLKPGSLVMCRWSGVINTESSPSCYSYSGIGGYDHRYHPKDEWGLCVVMKRGDKLIVQAPVTGYSYSSNRDRSFNAIVNLNEVRDGRLSYICLDDVTIEEIDYYLLSRVERESYIEFIPLFTDAKEALIQRDTEADSIRAELFSNIKQADVADVSQPAVQAIVNKAIRQYRVSNRWKDVPVQGDPAYQKHLQKIMNQVWIMVGKGDDRAHEAEKIAQDEGRLPIRLVVTGRNHIVLYATALPEEREERLNGHVWVQRIRLVERKTKVSVVDRRWVCMEQVNAEETVLHEWPEAADWAGKRATGHGLGYSQVQQAYDRCQEGLSRLLNVWMAEKDDPTFDALLDHVKGYIRGNITGSGMVKFPQICFSVGFARYTGKRHHYGVLRDQVESIQYRADPLTLLYRVGTDDQRLRIVSFLNGLLQSPEYRIDILSSNHNIATFGRSEMRQLPKVEAYNIEFDGAWIRLSDLASDREIKSFAKEKTWEVLCGPTREQWEKIILTSAPNMDTEQLDILPQWLDLIAAPS